MFDKTYILLSYNTKKQTRLSILSVKNDPLVKHYPLEVL